MYKFYPKKYSKEYPLIGHFLTTSVFNFLSSTQTTAVSIFIDSFNQVDYEGVSHREPQENFVGKECYNALLSPNSREGKPTGSTTSISKGKNKTVRQIEHLTFASTLDSDDFFS